MSTNTLTAAGAESILDTVTEFQLGAESVERYVGDPYVEGDNVAEHTARAVRMAIYAMPFILEEFKAHPDYLFLAQDIYATILMHDDDEIAEGFDVITMLKEHGARNEEEIRMVGEKISNLPEQSKTYALNIFASYRKRDTLASKIAKVFDNITGNQLVLEQKLGMVAPHAAKFALDYLEKVRGVSKTTDKLIDAQKKKIIQYRQLAKNDSAEIEILINKAMAQESSTLSHDQAKKLILELLELDISSLELQKEKILLKLWEYRTDKTQ